jgi:hypothetical protein
MKEEPLIMFLSMISKTIWEFMELFEELEVVHEEELEAVHE